MAPAAALAVDEPDVNLAALVRREVDGHQLELLGVVARGPVDHLPAVRPDDLDTGRLVRPSGDQEPGERSVELERHRRERPLWPVTRTLVAADPVVAGVPAVHVGAPREDRVALDRLPVEGGALGLPVPEIPGL